MKKKYYFTTCLLSLALLSACSNQEEVGCPSCGESQETVAQPYSVSFRLGGSVGTASRAVTQTDEEKALKSLYAVVFADADASKIPDGTANKAAEEDLFVAAIPVDLSNYTPDAVTQPDLSFVLGEQGNYNICFIANPSGHTADGKGLSGLANKIVSLQAGTSKVSDFKALVEEAAPSLESSFLMTSPFYAVTTAYGQTATIGTVELTRAVARIDVVNKADGVTVQKLVFHNYANKTQLISDGATFQAENIIATQEYTPEGGLEGSSAKGEEEEDDNYYGKQIYTYEQYAASGADATDEEASRPTLEIIYSIPTTGQWFTHTVKFEKAATEEPGQPTVIPLKRNNHYLVTLTNKGGSINFTLGVKDWDKGDTFEIAGSDFAQGTQTQQLGN